MSSPAACSPVHRICVAVLHKSSTAAKPLELHGCDGRRVSERHCILACCRLPAIEQWDSRRNGFRPRGRSTQSPRRQCPIVPDYAFQARVRTAFALGTPATHSGPWDEFWYIRRTRTVSFLETDFAGYD